MSNAMSLKARIRNIASHDVMYRGWITPKNITS